MSNYRLGNLDLRNEEMDDNRDFIEYLNSVSGDGAEFRQLTQFLSHGVPLA
jgi:hypothetical protein